MKKNILLSIIPILFLILIQTQYGTAATFGVAISDTFTYDCITSERSVVWGTDSSSSEGYSLEGHDFAVGTSVLVEVINIVSDSVAYTVSKDGFEEGYLSDATSMMSALIFDYGLNLQVIKSLIRGYGWNQTFWDEPPLLNFDNVFIEIDTSTWSEFADFLDSLTGFYSTITPTTGLTMDTVYINDDSTFACELHLHGILNATYTPITSPAIPWVDYSDDFDQYCRLAYDKSTGALLGMHVYGSMTGTSNGTNYDITFDSHVEKEGYDLPDNINTSTGGFPGYSIAITVGGITTLLLIAVYIKRKIVVV
ncbi:MAG: hypothetical protein KGD59_02380 [Candidatus Heimdallarchaeota archaeon]|nr:hypothetical protein [Candidatus Heimdallarchaeota archaeon]MBY8993368.1 hypothetical protein [Candidatus Heimdallarchaeota archaeon]